MKPGADHPVMFFQLIQQGEPVQQPFDTGDQRTIGVPHAGDSLANRDQLLTDVAEALRTLDFTSVQITPVSMAVNARLHGRLAYRKAMGKVVPFPEGEDLSGGLAWAELVEGDFLAPLTAAEAEIDRDVVDAEFGKGKIVRIQHRSGSTSIRAEFATSSGVIQTELTRNTRAGSS